MALLLCKPGAALLAVVGTALLVSGCAPLSGPAATPASRDLAVVAPNANLVVQGIPPIPASVAEGVARYTDFRGHRFVDWHPTRNEMLVSHRKAGGSTLQIFRIAAAGAAPEPLTDFADPVRVASYEPLRGEYVVFERGSGGDEATQLYRMDLATRAVTLLSNPEERHELQGWLHRTSALLYLSVPLDRTARGRSRSEISQTLSLVDPLQPQSRRRLAELPGGGWSVGGVSWDDTRIALTRYLSATESEVWLLDIASGTRQRLLPAPGEAPATHWAALWKRDDSGVFILSDRSGEFRELMFVRLADARPSRITRRIPWDVEGVQLDASGKLLAVNVNVAGRKEVRFFDGETFDELPTPALPEGSADTLAFHPRLPGLAVTVDDSRSPATVVVIDPATTATQRWSTPLAPPGVDTRGFGAQRIVS